MTDDPFQAPEGSRTASPQSAASVRSQAVAKLRRAASLPRKPIPRRPSHNNSNEGHEPSGQNGSSSGHQRQFEDANEASYPTLTPPHLMGPQGHELDQYGYAGQEEMLSPSPVPDQYPYPYISRSASSSSLHPTPPHLMPYSHNQHSQSSTPYDSASSASASPLPEWSMGIANQYMPQLSPAHLGHSPYMNPGVGRNTPSPLPSLGELRSISRSNSTAARARAMDKLTGGRETPAASVATPPEPADETPTRPGLQRADSLGARTHAPVADLRAAHPPSAFMEPRPRLQRSFTVSSSNMGVERRSAVGRRMVARLAERAADKQAEVEEQEAEVRRLWEERTGRLEPGEEQLDGFDPSYTERGEQEDEAEGDHRPQPAQPIVVIRDPDESFHADLVERQYDSLMPPRDDRPGSRNTQMSDTDVFEYAQHLSRSQSTRTARNMPVTPEKERGEVQEGADPEETLVQPPFDQADRPGHDGNYEQAMPTGSVHGEGLSSISFTMDDRASTAAMARHGSSGVPMSVGDQSGEWGTPGDSPSLHLSRTVPDSTRTPSDHSQRSQTSHPSPHTHSQHSQQSQNTLNDQDPDLTPPGVSTRTSVMSWEEVGPDSDRIMPSDATYHKKIGSIGAKMGSAVRAMRKRSHSRSSNGSNPASPNAGAGVGARPLQEALSIAVQGFSRRGSEASLSPTSGQSLGRAHARAPSEQVRHHPSMSSLSPSLHASTETSTANSILLQHQLTNDPQSRHEMPRARPDDPRVFNSKLSPFPGVERSSLSAQSPGLDAPRLIHQHSDSVVPSHTVSKSIEIHALPLVTPPEEHVSKFPQPSPTKRSSTDSKRGWFAKTLASATSPRSPRSSNRSSATPSRKASMTDMREAAQVQASSSASQALAAAVDRHAAQVPDKHPTFALPDNDIFGAALQPPSAVNAKNARSRPISPSVSTVAELNEDGHRMTQFTAFRSANQTPVMEEEMLPSERGSSAQGYGSSDNVSNGKRDQGVMRRMSAILELEADDPVRPDVLDDPPRKLVLAMQVWQVVDENAAKDRYLLLFNDILVICKPIIPAGHSGQITLDTPMIVKSVIPLDRLHASGLETSDSDARSRNRDDFASRFARDPFGACLDESDNTRLAHRLVSTPALDPVSMGTLLSHSSSADLLSAFLQALRLQGCSLVDALRILLLAAALPEDQAAGDALLESFARSWHTANVPPYSAGITVELVHSLIHLSDEIHGNRFGFALRNPSVSVSAFITSFRQRDPDESVDESTLRGMYRAVETAPLMPPLASAHALSRRIEVIGMPTKLGYDTWSDDIHVSIPEADSDLCITLQGDELEFEPSFLDFRQSGEQAFRVRGKDVGGKAVLMVRQGLNAPLYNNLPTAYPIHIHRAYMSHTFHLSFLSTSGSKRSYCIALPDAQSRSKWAMLLPRQINRCRTNAAQNSIDAEAESQDQGGAETGELRRRIAAEALSLGVLRDSLIGEKAADGGKRGSVSTTYEMGMGKDEVGTLGPLRVGGGGSEQGTANGNAMAQSGKSSNEGDVKTNGQNSRPTSIMTGKEIVLICRQNSILPEMLDMLRPSSDHADAGHGTNETSARSSKGDNRVDTGAVGSNGIYQRGDDEDRRQLDMEREREYEVESRAQSRAAGRF